MGIIRYYNYKGKVYTLSQAANEFGIDIGILHNRFASGMCFERAIRNKTYNYEGKVYTLTQAAKEFGINRCTLSQRLNSGMSIEQAIKTPIKKHRDR